MKTIQFTLYELFGYAFPGAFGLAGVFLILWRLFLPIQPDWGNVSATGWWLCIALAYVFGHSLQGLGNLFSKWIVWHPELAIFSDAKHLPKELQELLNQKSVRAVGLEETNKLAPNVIYDIADHTIQQHGKTEMRDIYVYREGYYRGMTLGLLFFTVGLLFQLGRQTSADIFSMNIFFSSGALWLIAGFTFASAVLSYFRYRRMARYRVKYVLYSFLTKEVKP